MTGPDLKKWLALPLSDVAAQVAPHHLSVLLSLDGTRRHYLLAHPHEQGQITDHDAYFWHSARAYVRVFDLLYSLGVQTILTPNMYPLNFRRGEKTMERFLKFSSAYLVSSVFAELYERWGVRARLYGDFDLAPNAVLVRDGLLNLAGRLRDQSTTGERLLLFGYCAGSFNEEAVARSIILYQNLGRMPSEAEVRGACFPDGPAQVDIFIRAGALRTRVLPPLLDAEGTNLYSLVHLALDLTENTARRILYDHLFRRGEAPEDNMGYTPDGLAELADFYQIHRECVIGLGQLVGPDQLWYPDHDPTQHEN